MEFSAGVYVYTGSATRGLEARIARHQRADKKIRWHFDHLPDEAGRMLEDRDRVRQASVPEIKTMLTYRVRGDRICDGHWGAMIEQGDVRRLLERLEEIRAELD